MLGGIQLAVRKGRKFESGLRSQACLLPPGVHSEMSLPPCEVQQRNRSSSDSEEARVQAIRIAQGHERSPGRVHNEGANRRGVGIDHHNGAARSQRVQRG